MKKWNCCIVLLLLFAWIIFPAASAGGMNFRMDPQRLGDYSGVSGGFIPNDQLKWKYQTNGAIYSSPSIENNIVYIGSDDGNIYALDANTGALKWKFSTASEILSSPAVFNGIVYFGSYDGNLYALDAITGALKWKYLTANMIRSSPTVMNGIVFFGSWDHYIYALDANTGALKWKYLSAREILSSPAVINGIVYFGCYDNNLYALDAETGAFKWKYTSAGRIFSTPAVLNGVVYVGSNDNNLHVLDANTGSFKWKYPTSGWTDASPTVKDNLVYIGSDDNYLYTLDANTGAFKWKYETGSMIDSSVAIADGIVYFGSYDGNLYALDAVTGAFQWKYQTGNIVYSSPAIVNGVVYFGSVDGFVYAVGNQPVTGSINVVSDPPGAQIWIDGILQSYFTPYTFDGILSGTHAVKVHLDEYNDAENTHVVVTAGKTTLADFQLTALNKPPLANAGSDQTVNIKTLVVLDGTASSDPDGNTPLTYAWSLQSVPAGSTAQLSSTTADKPPFTPDIPGDYVFTLSVTDSLGLSSITFDTVTISATNQPPVASAGPDQMVIVNEPVSFDGSGSSDSDGTIVTYTWEFGDTNTGSGMTASHAYTTAGSYTASLTVTDDYGATGSDSAVITVKVQSPPALTNPGDQLISEGEPLVINLQASDPENDQLSYSFVSDKPLATATLEGQIFTWTPPLGSAGSYSVTFKVTDTGGLYDEESITITVNTAPITNVPVKVKIIPKTINLGSRGYFLAFVTLPEEYKGATIDVKTVSCSGAPAIRMMNLKKFQKNIGFVFKTSDLKNVQPDKKVTLIVEGELMSSGKTYTFTGSNTVRVISKRGWQAEDIRDVSKESDEQLFKKYSEDIQDIPKKPDDQKTNKNSK